LNDLEFYIAIGWLCDDDGVQRMQFSRFRSVPELSDMEGIEKPPAMEAWTRGFCGRGGVTVRL